MSLSAIIMVLIGLAYAVVGALLGHAHGKSSGRSQGRDQAKAEQASAKNEKSAQAARERINAEVEISSTDDDELDRRLSEHDRAG